MSIFARQLLHEFRPLFQLLREPVIPRSAFGGLTESFRALRPKLDVTEEGNGYIIEAELPGVKRENVDITIGDGGRNITIQGKTVGRRDDRLQNGNGGTNKDQAPNQLSTERLWSGGMDFTRTIWLPRPVDSTNVTAKLKDGVLTLQVPKLEDKESVKVHVE